MDFLTKPPKWLVDWMPEGARPSLEDWGWYVILLVLGLALALVVFTVIGKLRPRKRGDVPERENREEILAQYPEAKPSTGDRQLRIEGVPVRMRLVVVAPAGGQSEIDTNTIEKLLDRVLPGLGEIYKQDKPRLRIWPQQLSYEGFAKHFHRNTRVPEGDGELSRWAIVAGRAKLSKFQVMLGFALQGIKPHSIGRKSIEAHQWDEVLRIRVRD